MQRDFARQAMFAAVDRRPPPPHVPCVRARARSRGSGHAWSRGLGYEGVVARAWSHMEIARDGHEGQDVWPRGIEVTRI
eukprot:2759929-Rhodomonas_salina.1